MSVLGAKGGGALWLTSLPNSCADCLEIWEPQTTGNLVKGLLYFEIVSINTNVYFTQMQNIQYIQDKEVGWDSSVGIATRYGLEGPAIESQWERSFQHQSRPALGPIQPPIKRAPGLCRGKAAREWRWPPTPSSGEVKERVELFLYYPSEPLWTVLGWTLPLPELRFRVVEIFVNHGVSLWCFIT